MKKVNNKIPVGILGATGMVGQRLISLLEDHPWFEVVCVAASERSAGKSYAEAVGERWAQKKAMPKNIGKLEVHSVEHDVEAIAKKAKFVFSAIEAEKEFILKIEEAYASTGLPVVSNNSAHRWTDDVPMIMPEVNPHHLKMIDVQRKKRGWKNGFIITKPNCSIQCYVPLLHAWKKFEPQNVIVSTYQAISGAGKTFETWPEMIDNIIPYIGGEEEKSEKEPSKIWAEIKNDRFNLANAPIISANCIRVPVSDGHMAAINIQFKEEVRKDELINALRNFQNPLDKLQLPSAPMPFITYFEEDNRPQTQLDRDLHNGMGISVGRIRQDSVLSWKCVALSHNTVRGAAGGSVLNAELLLKMGYIN
ncbi:MAG: aspartate-semialdehyde dehydrogenase [Candidatus Levybacteria bacterium]|nr:aspartate-semialdehyde dehydrogenase [Candidatus Levybacteria bacterium]MDZ4228420.1 aspartate-semialdehyde dehydrogenase [Candidatus Levybacteria bacterium]